MKILHLCSTFFPNSTGGKEVFVYQLIKNIPAAEHRILLHDKNDGKDYVFDDIQIKILPAAITASKRRSYFDLTFDELPGFELFLQTFQPNLVHFHDESESASLSHLRICKKRGIKTLLTYHSPGQSCLQRSLLRNGNIPCDGWIDVTRCTACRYKMKGVPSPISDLLAHIEISSVDVSGKFIFANSTRLFSDSWHEFFNTIDKIQIHARWVKDLLTRNGVDKSKVAFIELGGHESIIKIKGDENEFSKPLKLVFVGRCADIKGAHLLIEAVLKLPESTKVEVYFFGPYWNDVYGISLKKLIGEDIRFHDPVLIPPNEVIHALKEMDVCVIPSLWPETGPFTLLDAFAVGIPVIGTNLAGIAERISDGEDGLLFEWNNVKDLSKKIQWLAEDHSRIGSLRKNIPVNRSFAEMGEDFYALYFEMLATSLMP